MNKVKLWKWNLSMGHIQIWHHILFLSKYIEVLQWLPKSKFLSIMTKVNPKNENEIKSDIFPWDIFKSDTFFYQNILKYFNDFQNQNFSILWLKWIQTMGMRQNRTFFQGSYSNLTLFFIGCKILKYFTDYTT